MAAAPAPPPDGAGALGDEFPIPSDSPLWAPVRALLNHVTLQEWLAQRPPTTVVTAPGSATCAAALRLLAAHNISSVPVFEGKACIGFVDVGDIVRALLTSVSIRSLTDENKEYRLRAAGLQLEHTQLRHLNPVQDGALIYRADMQSSLHDVVLFGFLQPNEAGYMHVVHRVGVFEADEEMSDDDAAAAGAAAAAAANGLGGISITAVISQSDVVGFLARRVGEFGALAGASLAQLGLASKPVVCVPAEMSTIKAFATMVSNQVSCVGVVSHGQGGGGLAASLSSSDLCGLLPEQFASALSMPVLQYLRAKASAGWSSHSQQQQQQAPLPQQRGVAAQPQALPPGSSQAWGLKSGEGQRPPELVCVSPDSTLREVLCLLAEHRLHRLHVTDERQRPVGIVTISDLLRVIIGCNELLQALGPDLDELEQEVDQMQCGSAPGGDDEAGGGGPDCGMDTGAELIEGVPLANVRSQALLSAAATST